MNDQERVAFIAQALRQQNAAAPPPPVDPPPSLGTGPIFDNPLLRGSPEGNLGAADVAGAVAAPAKMIWKALKADADRTRALRDEAKATTGYDTKSGAGFMDTITPLGPIAKVARAAEAMPAGIRAYHGSPYDFDRFDLSKIGTGEGAQAYGHGLYFAGNEGVARSYREGLSKNQGATIEGRIDPATRDMLSRIAPQFPTPAEMAETLRRRIEAHPRGGIVAGGMMWDRPVVKKALDAIESGRVNVLPPGRMYEVNIRADPNKFLDWDKYVAPGHRTAIARIGQTSENPGAREFFREVGESAYPLTGENAYRKLSGALAPKEGAPNWTTAYTGFEGHPRAAAALRDAGIPGIKYLDQGSRATAGGEILGVEKAADGMWRSKIRVQDRSTYWANSPGTAITTSMPFKTEAEALKWAQDKVNAGTSNYVLFRDDIIDILRKYGIAGAGVAGAGALAGAGGDPASAAMPQALRGSQ